MPRGRGRRRPPQSGSGARVVVPVDLGPGQLQVAERDVDVLLDVRRAGLQQQHADVGVLRKARGKHASGRARSDDHVVVHRTSSSVGPIPLGTLAQEPTPLARGQLLLKSCGARPRNPRLPRRHARRSPAARARSLDRGGARGGDPAAGLGRLRHRRGGRPALGPHRHPQADRGRRPPLHLGPLDPQGPGDRGQPPGRPALPLAGAGPPGPRHRRGDPRRARPRRGAVRRARPASTSCRPSSPARARRSTTSTSSATASRTWPRSRRRRRPAPRTGARCGSARGRSSSGAKPTTASTSGGSSSARASGWRADAAGSVASAESKSLQSDGPNDCDCLGCLR